MSGEKSTRVRWLLVFWLFVLSAVSFLDRVNISIAGPSIANDFQLTDVQLGRVFSALLIGYTLFQTPGGWLADRLGPRRVLTAGVLWWGIFTALTATVYSGGHRAPRLHLDSVSSRSRRSNHLPGIQPVRGQMDSHR